MKVGDKYYLADENGNRRFAYVDENGKKVVLYKGKYYLTDVADTAYLLKNCAAQY